MRWPRSSSPARGAGPSKRPLRREWILRLGFVATLVALVVSLMDREDLPADAVHTHHAFRLYADGDWIEFPLYNFEGRDVNVHIHRDDLAGPRAAEIVHVHRAGGTLGDLLQSFTLEVGPGRLRLDDASRVKWAVHHGEEFADNGTHEWRLYVEAAGQPWTRVPGSPVDSGNRSFGVAERVLLTYVLRFLPDADSIIAAQQDAVVDDLNRWPQWTGE